MSRGAQSVLIMAGGTGGHIFPGLAVADSLRQRGIEVRWLGARGGMECQRVPAWGIPLDVVDISGLRGKGAGGWLLAPWKLLRAVFQAIRVLGERRPACAISFGGYAAGPGGLAARLRGVPLLVHEQNRVPGLTNRVLARFAARVLQAFPGTWGERLHPLTCGNPVRQDVAGLDAPGQRLADRSGPVRVLVTGGSQGARALNRLVPAALALAPQGLQLEIRHQCGKSWLQETQQAYRAAGFEVAVAAPVGAAVGAASAAIPESPVENIAAKDAPTAAPAEPARTVAEVTEFIDDMAAAYAWADVLLCRAGALTVSEVAAAGVAALFVPFPHAVDDHQTRNAEYLSERGAALVLTEAGLDAERLARELNPLLADRGRQLDMAERARAAAVPDAAGKVADLCREYLRS